MVGLFLGAANGIQKKRAQLYKHDYAHFSLLRNKWVHSIQHDHAHFSYYAFFFWTAKTKAKTYLRKEKIHRNTKWALNMSKQPSRFLVGHVIYLVSRVRSS